MGFVYLISNDYNHYKIGITTKTVEKRIKQLQTGNSEKINLVKYYKTEHHRNLEAWLHRKFGANRLEGEWFDLDDAVVLDFENICKSLESTIILLKEQNPFYN
jgi:hypothetical protein